MNELKSAEIAFLGNLPLSISNELKYALKAYHPTKKTVSTISYQKNNIIDNFTAIRKRKLITAKIKKMEWQKEERHEEKNWRFAKYSPSKVCLSSKYVLSNQIKRTLFQQVFATR